MGFPIDESIRNAMGGPPAEWNEEQQSQWYEGWLAWEDDYVRSRVERILDRFPEHLPEVRTGWEARAAVHARRSHRTRR